MPLFEPPIDLPEVPTSGQRTTAGQKRKRHQRELDKDVPHEQDHQDTASEEEQETEPSEPPFDFPHAPLEVRANARVITQQRNLKRQHFHALNAVLHRCLLDHDYERASKAFGLLLRFTIDGKRVNLRQKGLWGIGAEILLQKRGPDPDVGVRHDTLEGLVTGEEGERQQDEPSSGFSEEGYEAARAYYQRLILQYPFRKSRPHAVSAQHFYPAMFTIWIFQVQARSKRRKEAVEPQVSSSFDASQSHNDETDGLRAESELQGAREISVAMDEVVRSPPYDQDPVLLKLSARVKLWIRDLSRRIKKPSAEVLAVDSQATATFQKAHQCGASLTQDELLLLEATEDGRAASETDTSSPSW